MHLDRASEDIYIFTSDRYAQVTATLIASGSTGVLIDTLPFPTETAQIALFARKRCPDGVRFIIYTGHEADHVYGAFLFPKAEIIAHERGREVLLERGEVALARAREQSPEFGSVQIKLPTFTFTTGSTTLRLPGKTLEIIHTPGHTPDSVSVLLQEEKILFAGDTVMALPTIANGDPEQLKQSLDLIGSMQLENIVQGHGEMILRGEIKDNLKRQVNYLDNIRTKVQNLIQEGGPREAAKAITIESCGMQRVLLNGMVTALHHANVLALYDRLAPQPKPIEPARSVASPAPEVKASQAASRAKSAPKSAPKPTPKSESKSKSKTKAPKAAKQSRASKPRKAATDKAVARKSNTASKAVTAHSKVKVRPAKKAKATRGR